MARKASAAARALIERIPVEQDVETLRVAERPEIPRESNVRPEIVDDELRKQIAEAAYYLAEKRGFMPGSEIEDWLAAESEVMRRCRGVDKPN